MNNITIDMAYKSLNHVGEELCGDKVEIVNNDDSRILILADLLGGSVSNAVTRLALLPNVRLVNGMNLATVIGLYFATPDIDGDELEALLADARRGLALADPGRWKNTGDEEEIL